MSAAARALHGAPTRCLGVQAGAGGGQVQRRPGWGWGEGWAPSWLLHPQLLCPGSGWLVLEVGIRLALGQMGGRLHWGILQNVPLPQGLRDGGPSFRLPSCFYFICQNCIVQSGGHMQPFPFK